MRKTRLKRKYEREREREFFANRIWGKTCVVVEKKFITFSTSKDLVSLLSFNFSISVTNALPTTKENMCVSINLQNDDLEINLSISLRKQKFQWKEFKEQIKKFDMFLTGYRIVYL